MFLEQALAGVHRAKVQQLLGRTIQSTVDVHVFNHQASLSTVAAIKSSCIGAPHAFSVLWLLREDFVVCACKATQASDDLSSCLGSLGISSA